MGSQFDIRSMYGQANALLNADSNGVADSELIAAKAGFAIVIDKVVFSADAAASFLLESENAGGDTVIFPTIYLAAGAPFTLEGPNLFRGLVSEAISLTISVTGNCSAFVQYHYEQASGS